MHVTDILVAFVCKECSMVLVFVGYEMCLLANIHHESKNGDILLLSMTLPNVDRFSKFFHEQTHQ